METQDTPKDLVSYFHIHSVHRTGSHRSTLWSQRKTKASKLECLLRVIQWILRKVLACGEREWPLPDGEATGP